MRDAREDRFPRRFGDHLLTRRLAVGGMAEVFEAWGTGPGGFRSRVALKRLLPAYRDEGRLVRALLREARLAAMLRHPCIARAHQVGQVDGAWYFTLDLVEGADLYRLCRHLGRRGRRLPIALSVYAIARVCDALHHAHRRRDPDGRPLRIVHRDVSPQNVLLGREGDVTLVDFGIARTALRRTRTDRGVIKGKAMYMSPEQASGGRVDARADVYAAGVVLRELVTGAHPWADRRADAVFEAARAPAWLPAHVVAPDVPRPLSDVLDRALAVDPADRHPTAGDLADALVDVLHRGWPGFSPRRAALALEEAFDAVDGTPRGTPGRPVAAASTPSPRPAGPPPLPPAPRGEDTPTESWAPPVSPRGVRGSTPGHADPHDDPTMVVDTGLFDVMLHTATETLPPAPAPDPDADATRPRRRGWAGWLGR